VGLAALYIIHRICDYYNVTTSKVILYCDNKGAITNSFQPARPGISPFLSPDYDLLHMIKQIVTLIPMTLVGEWVKGHYTGKDRKPQHDMNALADELAGEHLRHQGTLESTNGSTLPCPGYKILLLKDTMLLLQSTSLSSPKGDTIRLYGSTS
jgi:hypothetical protein